MLLNSTHVIPRSHKQEESASLRSKIEELNKNALRLLAEAQKLIQESRLLSEQIKSLPSARY